MSDIFNMGEEEREPDVHGAVPATERPPANLSSPARLQPTPRSEIEVFDGGASPALREAPTGQPIQAQEGEEPAFDGGAAT
jgi:hypothetical protein